MKNSLSEASDICIGLQNLAYSRNVIAALPLFQEHAKGLIERRELDINIRQRSEVQVIQLRGQLRMGSAVDDLQHTVEEAFGNGDTRLVLNLADVKMIDSSGIGLLVRLLAIAKQRGGNLKLVQPSKFAVQTLRMVGVINLFEIFEDDDRAVESFA
jgi:anti-sigma B factor antagonist